MSARSERRVNRRIVLLAGGLAAAFLVGRRHAHAWVPPGEFLLGKVADKRRNVKRVQVSGIRTFVGRGYDGGKQDVSETLYATSDGAWRIERSTPKGEYVEVSDGSRRVVVLDGKAGTTENDSRALDRMLLVGADKDALLEAAKAYGIQTEVTAMSRVDDRVIWIVGAKSKEAAVPQVWIDKDRDVPLAILDPRSRRVVRFEGWGESAGAGVLPSRVTWSKGDDLEQVLKVESVKVNPKLGADLFKPAKAVPVPSPAPSPKKR